MRKRKIILKQHQSPGDILVFTRAVSDIKQTYPDWDIDVRTPCPDIFNNNPHLTPLKEKDPDVEIISLKNDEEDIIHKSGVSGVHYTEGFVLEAEKRLKVPIKRHGILPEIFISKEEKGWVNQVADNRFGIEYTGNFWIINAGYKKGCELKWYPFYQEVVNLLKDKIQFVQIGYQEKCKKFNNPKEVKDERCKKCNTITEFCIYQDHVHRALSGVFNLVGQTNLREMIRLAYWSSGSLGPISFQMHLSAALNQAAVVLAGGKEPVRWEMYPMHRYLAVNGCMKCASGDGCWKSELKDCKNRVGGHPRCFSLTRPEDVARAVELYYLGGILSYG
jgi:ADP-heptose:LPS heptosyltransferase